MSFEFNSIRIIIMNQKTLVLIKPDAMNRGLVGEIISRLERVGLKMIACRLVKADHHLASTHYPVTEEWLMKVGKNTLADCEKYEVDVVDAMAGLAGSVAVEH